MTPIDLTLTVIALASGTAALVWTKTVASKRRAHLLTKVREARKSAHSGLHVPMQTEEDNDATLRAAAEGAQQSTGLASAGPAAAPDPAPAAASGRKPSAPSAERLAYVAQRLRDMNAHVTVVEAAGGRKGTTRYLPSRERSARADRYFPDYGAVNLRAKKRRHATEAEAGVVYHVVKSDLRGAQFIDYRDKSSTPAPVENTPDTTHVELNVSQYNTDH